MAKKNRSVRKGGKSYLTFKSDRNRADLALSYPHGKIRFGVTINNKIKLHASFPRKTFRYLLETAEREKQGIGAFFNQSEITSEKGTDAVSYFEKNRFSKWLKKLGTLDDTLYDGCTLLSHWFEYQTSSKKDKT